MAAEIADVIDDVRVDDDPVTNCETVSLSAERDDGARVLVAHNEGVADRVLVSVDGPVCPTDATGSDLHYYLIRRGLRIGHCLDGEMPRCLEDGGAHLVDATSKRHQSSDTLRLQAGDVKEELRVTGEAAGVRLH